MKKKLYLPILICSAILLSSCSYKSTDETSHPLFRRAVKAQEANELKLAIKYFNRYLAINPESSKTHLILASIYDENLDKPLRAIYHYQRFLEFAPNSTEATNVKKWITAAKKKFYERSRKDFNDPEDVGALQNSLYTTDQEVKKLKAQIKELKNIQKELIKFARRKNKEMKTAKLKYNRLEGKFKAKISDLNQNEEKIKKLSIALKKAKEKQNITKSNLFTDDFDMENAIVPPMARKRFDKIDVKSNIAVSDKTEKPEKMAKKSPAKPPKDDNSLPLIPEVSKTIPPFVMKEAPVKTPEKKQVSAQQELPQYRYYTVQKGDSLSSISRRFFGTSKYYKKIFDSNRDVLTDVSSLRPGQVLKIPDVKE